MWRRSGVSLVRTAFSSRAASGMMMRYSSTFSSSPWVSVSELREALDNQQKGKEQQKERVVLIDTRPAEAYNKSHLAGAVRIEECFTHLLPMSDKDGMAELERTFRELFGQRAGITGGPYERVVFYEEGLTSGFAQSCRGYFLLKWLGHPNVSVLQGGLAAWRQSGGPLSTETPHPDPAQLQTKTDTSLMATKDDVLRALGDKSEHAPVLLDVRDAEEWKGTSSSPYGKDFCPRKGRLPGAKWLEWYDLHERRDGVTYTKPVDDVKAILEKMGIGPDRQVIVYCFKGSRASNTLMQLRNAGIHNVTNYFGSWNEWSRDNNLPIDSSLLHSTHA